MHSSPNIVNSDTVLLPFSVCMSVYKNDQADIVKAALESIIDKQTVQPAEVVLVEDGPIDARLEQMLSNFAATHPILRIIHNPQNKGLGVVLRQAVESASYDIIARMDSDDLALPDRFEKQLRYLAEHPETDIVGGQITEFIDSPNNIIGSRIVPLDNDSIYSYLKSRCPLNHVSVMFRKASVLNAGNYQPWFNNEDYYLWIRMAKNNCQFANLPDTLVNTRVGNEMYSRRGGWQYFKSERGIQRYLLKNNLISIARYCYNVLGRFAVQVIMPNRIRGFVYKKLFRQQRITIITHED